MRHVLAIRPNRSGEEVWKAFAFPLRPQHISRANAHYSADYRVDDTIKSIDPRVTNAGGDQENDQRSKKRNSETMCSQSQAPGS